MFPRMLKYIWLVIVIFVLPLFASGHGDNYLEFNPDTAVALKVSDVAVPSQVFFPQSDFLGGFDLWLANPGSGGAVTFSLLNEQGSVVAVRTVNIGSILETSEGTRFHVDLSSQIAILGNHKYSIKVTSSIPDLKLYYSNRIQIISHNAPIASEYITGVGKLGEEKQDFSFKYALYETKETLAPTISNVAWTVILPDQMRVDFNANEPVDYRMEYGFTEQGYSQNVSFTNEYHFCASGISTCSFIVSVVPNATYQYALTVKDFWGNQSQVTGTFTSGQVQSTSPTPIPSDLPLVISNFRIVNKTDKAISVAWTTNKAANSNLLVSFSTDLITITAVSDPTLELEHFLETDSVLSPGTTYTARVTSADLNNSESSASLSFKTLSVQTVVPSPLPIPSPSTSSGPSPIPSLGSLPAGTANPEISSQANPTPPATNIVTSSLSSGGDINIGTVQWSPPASGEPKDGYRVDVFDKEGKLVTSIIVADNSHGVEMPDLADGEYTVIVYSNNDGVFKKIDKPVELRAGEPPFAERLIFFWPYFLIVIALTGVLIWFRKRRASQTVSQVVP
jgi:hypothetical protein